MRITFLGTGTSQGVPVIACNCRVCISNDEHDKRLRCSVLIEQDDTIIVIDAGPDFRQQLLRAGVKKLDAVVFTHEHKDHIAGLDDVRAFNFFQDEPMQVYATKEVQIALKREYHYVFDGSNYPGKPQIELNTIDEKEFSIKNITLIPIKVMHLNMPVLGFRINDFTYITDANYIDELERNKVRNCRYIVLNALRKQHHISHFSLDEALEVIRDLNPEKGLLTHISHQMGLHHEINDLLPESVKCAYDGLVLNL